MAAIPLRQDAGKLRSVLDYLPCDACLRAPSEEQDLLCSVCRRLHREVAVKLVERRQVIVETPAPPPPPPVEEIPPAAPAEAEPEPVDAVEAESPDMVPAEAEAASEVEPEPVPAPEPEPEPEPVEAVAAAALLAQEEDPHAEAESIEAAAEGEPEMAPAEAVAAETEAPVDEAEEEEDDFDTGFAVAAPEEEDDVGFGLATTDATSPTPEPERPLAELDPELLALAESEPDLPGVDDASPVEDDDFTFKPLPRESTSEEVALPDDMVDALDEAPDLEEEEWMPAEADASAPAAPAKDPLDLLEEEAAPEDVPEPGSAWDVEGLTSPDPGAEEPVVDADETEGDEILEMTVVEDREGLDAAPVEAASVADDDEEILEMTVVDDEEDTPFHAPHETAAVDLPLRDLPGMEVGHVERLAEAGVEDVADLAGRDPWGLAELTGVSGMLLERWVLVADLAHVGVPTDYAHAIARAGVKSLEGFVEANPEALARDANGHLPGEVTPLTAGDVEAWQARARGE